MRSLSKGLGRASPSTIARLLKPLGFSLKSNIKRLIGKPHPQRDLQYRFIQRCKALFARHGQPVISIDAKKSELIGQFKNSGARYCRAADEVNTYDFPSDATAKATPYGIYDARTNKATVVVGTSATTPQFAVNAIRLWWRKSAQRDYPGAHHLMIEADSGGCNGHRPRMWKAELQRLCNELQISVTVCHYPPGASKWNPIEHRLFSQISRNWAGTPLSSVELMLACLRGTTTSTGLEVAAYLDERIYEKGLTISPAEMKSIGIRRRKLCPDLNYTIRPQPEVPGSNL